MAEPWELVQVVSARQPAVEQTAAPPTQPQIINHQTSAEPWDLVQVVSARQPTVEQITPGPAAAPNPATVGDAMVNAVSSEGDIAAGKPGYAVLKTGFDYLASKAGALAGDLGGLDTQLFNKVAGTSFDANKVQSNFKQAAQDVSNLMSETPESKTLGNVISKVIYPWTATTKLAGDVISGVTGNKVLGETVEDVGNFYLPGKVMPKVTGKVSDAAIALPTVVSGVISGDVKPGVITALSRPAFYENGKLSTVAIDPKTGVPEGGLKNADGSWKYTAGPEYAYKNAAGEVVSPPITRIGIESKKPVFQDYKESYEKGNTGPDVARGALSKPSTDFHWKDLAATGTAIAGTVGLGPHGMIGKLIDLGLAGYGITKLSDVAGAIKDFRTAEISKAERLAKHK